MARRTRKQSADRGYDPHHLEKLESLSSQLDASQKFSTYFHFSQDYPVVMISDGSISYGEHCRKRFTQYKEVLESERRSKMLTDISLLFGDDVVEDALKGGERFKKAERLLSAYFLHLSSERFKEELNTGHKDVTRISFGLFLYLLTRRKDSFQDRALMRSLRDPRGLYGIAKAFQLSPLARFVSNYSFMHSEEGVAFLASSIYVENAKELMATLKGLENTLHTLFPLLNEYGGVAFSALRLKSPFDSYEKILKYRIEKNMGIPYPEDAAASLLELHDLIGVRIVLNDPLSPDMRASLLDAAGGAVLNSLEGYEFNDNQPFSSSNDFIRDYHRKPKRNGYDRYHLLLRTPEGFPIEFQFDTLSRYEEIENSPETSHGVQKSNLLKSLIENFRLNNRVLIDLELALGSPKRDIHVKSSQEFWVCEDNEVLLKEVEKLVEEQVSWKLSDSARKKILNLGLEGAERVNLRVRSADGRSWKVNAEVRRC